MEPDYSRWFDTNTWMDQYSALQEQQRARQESDHMPADQAGFERQLCDLQLNSSDEGAPQAGSPDARPSEASSPETHLAEAHGSIQRTDVAGSMRMPPRSNLRDNSFSSMRYTAPSEVQPAARTKDSKSRGLFSRVRTGLVKAFGGSRREKSSGAAASDVVYSELRIDFAKHNSASSGDEKLFSEFRRKLLSRGYTNRGTAGHWVKDLRDFSKWLESKGLTVGGLVDDEVRLRAEGRKFNANTGFKRALNALLQYRAGNVQGPPLAVEDQKLFSEFEKQALRRNYSLGTTQGRLSALREFGRWLRLEPRRLTLARLLDVPKELADRAADEFLAEGGSRDIKLALGALRDFRAEDAQLCAPSQLRGPRQHKPGYSEDVALIKEFVATAKRLGVVEGTADRNAGHLRGLAEWLRETGKPSIASRFQTPAETQSLADDIVEYTRLGKDPHERLDTALSHLRRLAPSREEFASGAGPKVMGRRSLYAYPDDAELIDLVTAEKLRNLGPQSAQSTRNRILTMASFQRSFSDWLQRENKGSIVSRLRGDKRQIDELKSDFKQFNKPGGVDLKSLRQYLQIVEANKALGVDSPEQADWEPGAAGSSSTWPPRVPSDFDPSEWPAPEGPSGLAGWQEAAGSGSTWSLPTPPSYFDPSEWPTPEGPSGLAGWQETAGSGSTWSLPTPPSDFDPSEWPTPEGPSGQAGWQETAGSGSTWSLPTPPSYFDASEWPTPERAPALSSDIYRGLDPLVDLPSSSYETPDDAQSAPVLSPAGRSPFFIGPSGASQELEDIGYLVGDDWQHGSQPISDLLLDVLDNKMLLPSSRMVPQAVSINGETYSITLGPQGRRDAQFIHHPRPPSAPDAQIGALATSALSRDRSGRVLDAREWLGDEHIHRDYELLAQELLGNNPDLASRTRFVDPLIAQQLRAGPERDVLGVLQLLVFRNGYDSADFLFLPVSDAHATDPNLRGNHWSLLLVDRRDRERPVAYHYDLPRGTQRPACSRSRRTAARRLEASPHGPTAE
ncbi:Ulp1 family isopeptidase [Bradyrhizobium sp. USDA 10063]